MANLGTFILLAVFVICTVGCGVGGGARRRSWRLVESGIGAFHSSRR